MIRCRNRCPGQTPPAPGARAAPAARGTHPPGPAGRARQGGRTRQPHGGLVRWCPRWDGDRWFLSYNPPAWMPWTAYGRMIGYGSTGGRTARAGCPKADKAVGLSGGADVRTTAMIQKRARDRRIQKTEALLQQALGALIREKPYQDIVVKEILSRANVGRSTFYTHFADKDELLLSCIRDLLLSSRPVRPRTDPVWFSLPVFEHIERHRRSGEASMEPRGRREIHEHLEQAIVELIEDDVGPTLRRSIALAGIPSPDLVVRWIAASFVLVLNWWVDGDCRLPAREADALFRALVEPSLARALP